MASSTSLGFLQLFILAVLVGSSRTAADCYTALFAFGDSMTETGNYLISSGRNSSSHVAFLPYGETFFHHPTGRYCDGRIIVDFLAEAFGLPLLQPYLGGPGRQGFSGGANFAFAGATTLDAGFFIDRGMEVFTENSLRVQLEWFKQLLPSLCSSVLGELGQTLLLLLLLLHHHHPHTLDNCDLFCVAHPFPERSWHSSAVQSVKDPTCSPFPLGHQP